MSSSRTVGLALRHHGLKSLLPGNHVLRAFPTRYALKDIRYPDLRGITGRALHTCLQSGR